MGGSAGKVIRSIPIVSDVVRFVEKPIKADKQAKKQIEQENAAIEEEERKRQAASKAKTDARRAFQSTLTQAGDQTLSDSNVATGRLFGN